MPNAHADPLHPCQDVLSKHHSALRTGKTLLEGDGDDNGDDDDNDLFTVKNIEYPSLSLDKASLADLNAPSKRSLRRIKADGKAKSHAVYDDEGNLVSVGEEGFVVCRTLCVTR